jgi:hypothetical protein
MIYYFDSGTSWVVPAGVTGIQVECYGSSYGQYGTTDELRGNYSGGSYSKSNLINVTGGSTVYMNIGSLGGNTWFNTTNAAPTSSSSSSSACLAVGGNTVSTSQIASNCGNTKYKGGSGLPTPNIYTTSSASGGQAGPNGNGADVVGPYTNTQYPVGGSSTQISYSGGGANGGSSGSLGVPPYGRSGTGTVGSGAYWNGTSFIGVGSYPWGGFTDPVGQYLFLNNTATTPTSYGPTGGGAATVSYGSCCSTYYLQEQKGFIVITLVYVNGRKTVTLTGNGTWDLPTDWNDANNIIEVYGAGGAGATSGSTSFSGGGGGGGGYTKGTNIPLKASNLAGYITSKTYNSDSLSTAYLWQTPGTSGSVIYAGFGTNASGISNGVGGSGGTAVINSVSYTTTSFSGGNGGAGRTSSTAAGGGGGAAAGPNGAGGAGGSNTTTLSTTGRGGGGADGGNNGSSTSNSSGLGYFDGVTYVGTGGPGGSANTSGSAGGNGNGISIFSGGGGGGAGDGTSGTVGGAGGLFGGGGGGSGSATSSTGGVGRSGVILISYIPIVVANSSNFFFFF